MTTNVYQGFSTNKTFQHKKLTNQELRAQNVFHVLLLTEFGTETRYVT